MRKIKLKDIISSTVGQGLAEHVCKIKDLSLETGVSIWVFVRKQV